MNISFRPLSGEHFPFLLRWLSSPHVKAWWNSDKEWTLQLIREKYETYVDGYKLEAGVCRPIHAFIIYGNDIPLGYIQLYNAYDFARSRPLEGLPLNLGAIDYYIGEARFLMQGVGLRALELFLSTMVTSYGHIFVDPDALNGVALKIYEKAGFRRVGKCENYGDIWMLKSLAKKMLPRDRVLECVSSIKPVDALEDQHVQETIIWIQGGAPLFRIEKPAIPERHLVSYFVLYDEEAQKILLVDHIKAGLWLPSGGHVEIDEDPRQTVVRECHEELGVEADFFQDDPLFLTITKTVGMTAGHTDVSLWYVLRGDHQKSYAYDASEFKGIRWFDFDQIPFDLADPHLSRFLEKLRLISKLTQRT